MTDERDNTNQAKSGKQKSPAFQFYPKDFLSDEDVQLMSNAAVGCYIKLLSNQWLHGSIPTDSNRIAKLCGEDSNAMAELWQTLSKKFPPCHDDATRLANPKLERIRSQQIENSKKRVAAGQKGAAARYSNDLRSSNATILPVAKSSSPTTTASTSTTAINKKEKRLAPLPSLEKYPKLFSDPLCQTAWDLWQAHRREIKKPLTPLAAQKALESYADRPDDFVRDINHTIRMGWQGLRAPDQGRTQTKQTFKQAMMELKDL